MISDIISPINIKQHNLQLWIFMHVFFQFISFFLVYFGGMVCEKNMNIFKLAEKVLNNQRYKLKNKHIHIFSFVTRSKKKKKNNFSIFFAWIIILRWKVVKLVNHIFFQMLQGEVVSGNMIAVIMEWWCSPINPPAVLKP